MRRLVRMAISEVLTRDLNGEAGSEGVCSGILGASWMLRLDGRMMWK